MALSEYLFAHTGSAVFGGMAVVGDIPAAQGFDVERQLKLIK